MDLDEALRLHYPKEKARHDRHAKRERENVARALGSKWYSIEAKYGLTQAGWMALYESQNGLCALCGEPLALDWACVDHCHTTGKVRGLLHSQCNVGLGFFGDSIERIRKALTYLELHA